MALETRPSRAPDAPASVLSGTSLHFDDPGGSATDKALDIKGMPPNFGNYLLPHVVTFQGIVSSVSRVYRYYDEAMKHSQENARFMKNDLVIEEPMRLRKQAVAALNWHLEVDEPKDPVAKGLCENMTKILRATPHFTDFRESLQEAVWLGKQANQWRLQYKTIHGVENSTEYGSLRIGEWKPIHGDKIVFRYDDGRREYDPNQVGIRVGAGYTAGDKLIAERMTDHGRRKIEPTDYGLAYFLDRWERDLLGIHKHIISEDGEYEDPQAAGKIHGIGIRSKVYWTWYMKQSLFSYLMTFLERAASGIEIWYYPWGNDQAEKQTREAAQNRLGNNNNIVLMPRPMDESGNAYGVEMIFPNMAGAETIHRMLTEYFGALIKRYILGQTSTTEANPSGIGSNLPLVHMEKEQGIIKYDAVKLDETMATDVVEVLKLRNYPRLASIPVRFVSDTESADTDAKLDAWKKAYDVGLKMKASEWYDLLGASKPEDDDDIIQSPMAQQQDQLYAQWQESQQAKQAGATGTQVQGGLGGEEGQPGDQPPEGAQPEAQSDQNQQDLAEYGANAAAQAATAAKQGAEQPGANGQGQSQGQPTSQPYAAGAADPFSDDVLDAIERGTEQEMKEHNIDRRLARKLAADHIREHGPQAYALMEKALDNPPSENSEREKVEKYLKDRATLQREVADAAAATDKNPSPEQVQSGNYKKGKVTLHGMQIAIENPAGSTRRGVGPDGKPWSVKMRGGHYGYIVALKGQRGRVKPKGADGDMMDVFIGESPESEIVFVIDQTKAPDFKDFDEAKVMIGWTNAETAKQAYLDNYSPGWRGFQAVTAMTVDQFKRWLEQGNSGKPVAQQVTERYQRPASGQERGPLPAQTMPQSIPPAAAAIACETCGKSRPGECQCALKAPGEAVDGQEWQATAQPATTEEVFNPEWLKRIEGELERLAV